MGVCWAAVLQPDRAAAFMWLVPPWAGALLAAPPEKGMSSASKHHDAAESQLPEPLLALVARWQGAQLCALRAASYLPK